MVRVFSGGLRWHIPKQETVFGDGLSDLISFCGFSVRRFQCVSFDRDDERICKRCRKDYERGSRSESREAQ